MLVRAVVLGTEGKPPLTQILEPSRTGWARTPWDGAAGLGLIVYLRLGRPHKSRTRSRGELGTGGCCSCRPFAPACRAVMVGGPHAEGWC